MAVTIQSVALDDKKNLERFLHLPWKIHSSNGKRDPHWVPPFLPDQRSLLSPKSNPFF